MSRPLNDLPPGILLYGGTGQAKVVRPIIEWCGSRVVAVVDDTPNLPPPFDDVPLLFGQDGLHAWLRGRDLTKVGFCISIGNPHGRARLYLHQRLASHGLSPVSIAHHTAYLAEGVRVGEGAQILAGAIVGVEARLGVQCIVNTRASVDHECVLEDGVEVAPGATLCGLVHVETNGWVCAGATVLPRRRVGADAVVGAGAVVTRDVPPGSVVVGVPARPLARRQSEEETD